MNLARITELKELIGSLHKTLKALKTRKEDLEREAPNTKDVQERIEYAVTAAKNRVSALEHLGLRADFLEQILDPVQRRPDCSGVSTVVSKELADVQDRIQDADTQLQTADQEKTSLETEDIV